MTSQEEGHSKHGAGIRHPAENCRRLGQVAEHRLLFRPAVNRFLLHCCITYTHRGPRQTPRASHTTDNSLTLTCPTSPCQLQQHAQIKHPQTAHLELVIYLAHIYNYRGLMLETNPSLSHVRRLSPPGIPMKAGPIGFRSLNPRETLWT